MEREPAEGIVRDTGRFAAERIASMRNLGKMDHFPSDLWREMGDGGILGIGIPPAYGGSGADPLTILLAGEAMVRQGHSPGIALSWLIHQIMGHFFLGRFGSPEQKETFLPGMARGRRTGALAISEAEAGARPKEMKTSATKEGKNYLLNGEKTFLTNGPFADFFVVFAVTGADDGRRKFTAFLVPEHTRGLTKTAGYFFPFLQPCPHGGIRLENCGRDRSSILGGEDTAWETLSVPFRTWEDVFLTGLISGGIGRMLEILLSILRKKAPGPRTDVRNFLGATWSSLEGIRVVSREAARKLDTGAAHPQIASMVLFSRQNIRKLLKDLGEFLNGNGLHPGDEWNLLVRDLVPMTKIAGSVHDRKREKIGKALLEERKNHEQFGSTL
ncbi:MAG TPA: acyl-CoA dehydrogenase family protein [Syntrophales bacterium]|nr:acyl-CoA dehydrogenase family protein [Syntrophales bacterium]HPX11000.1 acyl-CoA dehydrogenase family protein [Syntrophales bacterium]HQB30750.1 acyl-CoA dehydrogenase family protein [Syntrophales bacterium]HQN77032.1 acyl-CoA dehydrogenase family protein [Syntrophales bacterium]HQQ26357.1 acyl-CoA dehydrogenase family protein [Syntrophales bacterium]